MKNRPLPNFVLTLFTEHLHEHALLFYQFQWHFILNVYTLNRI